MSFINWAQTELWKAKSTQRVARGRGNQGDHSSNLHNFRELPEHAEWNRAVEAKKRARHARRLEKKGLTL